MLSLIAVRNYAVIDEVEVQFNAGLSVLTGETGAGKSILVDALGLALGDRADAGAVRSGCREARISVLFECPQDHPALGWLDERGLEHEQACLLRRVVSAQGRSRGFINNQPATLQDLRSVGSLLVNIHGQSAHQRCCMNRRSARSSTTTAVTGRWLRSSPLPTTPGSRSRRNWRRNGRLAQSEHRNWKC